MQACNNGSTMMTRERKNSRFLKPSFSSEETTNHSTAEIAGEPAGRKGAGRDIGGLAELVAARKGEGIRDGKDDGDGCSPKSATSFFFFKIKCEESDIPTKLSQINSNLKIATIPKATQLTGCEYNANQKNLLSVALICLVSGSADSKTQLLSPDCTLTSFHQRRPTNLLPAMFLR